MIKNIFINYNSSLGSHFTIAARAGYGWHNIENVYKIGGEESVNKENIEGFPIETEIKYKHFIGTDSVFEPTIGLGAGYYNYITKLKSSPSNGIEFTTKGFAQYITFGMNVHISEIIMSNIQFKKIMLNNISTKENKGDSSSEVDYVQGSGINDLSISLGIFYKLNTGD